MYRVLLIEDDATIAKIIQYYLKQCKEYEVSWAKNAGEALALSRDPVDIILLDIMLPDVDGLELCAKLRERIYCPIIFISCIDDEETIIKALDLGGDDYLTKPFNCKVLHARIQSNLRRVRIERSEHPRSQLSFRDFSVDAGGHSIQKNGTSIPLAPIEFGLLMHLIDHPGRIITLDELYEAVWGKPSFGDVRTVIVHIYGLRKKLEPQPNAPRYIKNVRGKGYLFDPDGIAEEN